MKKLLTILAISSICLPVVAVEYSCIYEENGTYYSFQYTAGETVTQHCEPWCDSDFWKDQCNKCKSQDYPRMLKAYKSGACKKIMPPKVYNNVEGCTCKVYHLEDGTAYGKECSGNLNDTCNANKAMKKLEWMLEK